MGSRRMNGQSRILSINWLILLSFVILSTLRICLTSGTHEPQPVANEDNRKQEDKPSQSEQNQEHNQPAVLSQGQIEKRTFVIEFLKALHDQYGDKTQKLQERQSFELSAKSSTSRQLLEAIDADGDMRRLVDWTRNSFSLSSISELTTQFVVSKLGSVNCPALLAPDKEDALVPRFLLFNEHYVDVPYELPINPTTTECLTNAKFDPNRKTVLLIHGYLGGYTLIDGLTNIKNHLLDLNRFGSEQAIRTFIKTSQNSNSSYVFTEDLNMKIRSQLYNVIIVDWFNGANPTPRSNYIKAAVNAQVVGKLIARFLSALVVQCGTPASKLQIIAHSLGCHVSGFTGKAMNAAGHRLGRITHLDPVGLCFGRLFSQPKLRLSPNDALETQAIHVSLNIFDNPLDGAHNNILVNGGRDQPGCGNQNEVTNSTSSSVSLLFDPAARFAPCSHLRALALFEDDHSSQQGECQIVGYRCANYNRFLAGKCGFCDATNAQCRLMSLPPLSMQFRTMSVEPANNYHYYDTAPTFGETRNSTTKNYETFQWDDLYSSAGSQVQVRIPYKNDTAPKDVSKRFEHEKKPIVVTTSPSPALELSTKMFGQPAYYVGGNELSRRADRRFVAERRERISQVIDRLRTDTRSVWTQLRTSCTPKPSEEVESGSDSLSEFEDLDSAAEEGENSTSSLNATFAFSTTPKQHQQATSLDNQDVPDESSQDRQNQDLDEQPPLGSQAIPAGSLNGPLFYVGTSSLSPYCVNYYQVRVLISANRLERIVQQTGLAPNKLQAQYVRHPDSLLRAAASSLPQRTPTSGSSGRDMLHLTIKLTDSTGHFFKGFSVLESFRSLDRVRNDFLAPSPLPKLNGFQQVIGLNEQMFEITMLLNSTRAQPSKISETIISYYFHPIVLADRVEVNYMSNISPEIRAKYSSVLCPAAINDRHQLVKYIECHKLMTDRKKRRKRRRRRWA